MSGSESEARLGSHSMGPPMKRKMRAKKSNIWSKFTIFSHKDSIASCNICGCKLSYKSTVNNLKKHVMRKHFYDVDNACLLPIKPKKGAVISDSRPNLSSLGGLEGLILNVVADEGEDPLGEGDNSENVEVIKEIYHEDEIHNYCDISGRQEEVVESDIPTEANDPVNIEERNTGKPGNQSRQYGQKNYHFQSEKTIDKLDKIKRCRIMDLQLECLEIKKYNMQMEALMLENQLNLPRSIFTEPLRRSDIVSRGTQTDIGGNNTKVFYVSDTNATSEGSQHFFTFRARLDD